VYTSLRRGSIQFMTLYGEWWTQRLAITEALSRRGTVPVVGLGLGLVPTPILRAPGCAVEQVTIVEQSADVIRLVVPSLHARHPAKIEVIEADAFDWQPNRSRRFVVAWHDIWPDPYQSGIEAEIARLEARYLPFADWQGAWPREYLCTLAR